MEKEIVYFQKLNKPIYYQKNKRKINHQKNHQILDMISQLIIYITIIITLILIWGNHIKETKVHYQII